MSDNLYEEVGRGREEEEVEYGNRQIGQIVKGEVSAIGVYSMLVNALIGSAILALPYAFYTAGIPLTFIVLFALLIFMTCTAWWVLEIMARTHGYVTSGAYQEEHTTFDETRSLLINSEDTEQSIEVHRPVNVIENVKYSFTDFAYVFGGNTGRNLTQLMNTLCLYGILWSCANLSNEAP